MKRYTVLLVAMCAVMMAVLPVRAQESTCEDKLRATRVYADALLKSRNRQEAESAQAISDLLKRVDSLQADMLRLHEQPPKDR